MKQQQLIRTFIAIDIDEPLQKALHHITQALQKKPHSSQVKWAPIENFHLTLRFLGEIPAEKIAGLKDVLAMTLKNIQPFELFTSKIILFPPTTHPHIVAHTFSINQELANLVQIIEKAVNQCGFDPEQRPFLPHLTLGRFHGHYELDLNDVPVRELPKQFTVKEVILFQSELKEAGSVYTALQRFKLCSPRA